MKHVLFGICCSIMLTLYAIGLGNFPDENVTYFWSLIGFLFGYFYFKCSIIVRVTLFIYLILVAISIICQNKRILVLLGMSSPLLLLVLIFTIKEKQSTFDSTLDTESDENGT